MCASLCPVTSWNWLNRSGLEHTRARIVKDMGEGNRDIECEHTLGRTIAHLLISRPRMRGWFNITDASCWSMVVRSICSLNLFPVASVEGPVFNITRVNRLHMGAYLCIASNGVPPSVSKRIMLIVHCEYVPTCRQLTDSVSKLSFPAHTLTHLPTYWLICLNNITYVS